MSAGDRNRDFILPADGREPVCVEKFELAQRFAVPFGDRTHIVDALTIPYYPVAQRKGKTEIAALLEGAK